MPPVTMAPAQKALGIIQLQVASVHTSVTQNSSAALLAIMAVLSQPLTMC